MPIEFTVIGHGAPETRREALHTVRTVRRRKKHVSILADALSAGLSRCVSPRRTYRATRTGAANANESLQKKDDSELPLVSPRKASAHASVHAAAGTRLSSANRARQALRLVHRTTPLRVEKGLSLSHPTGGRAPFRAGWTLRVTTHGATDHDDLESRADGGPSILRPSYIGLPMDRAALP